MLDENQPHPPRDRETLVRDVSVSLQLKDIKRDQELKEQAAARWWERGVVTLLFLSTVGFLTTLIAINFAPVEKTPLIFKYVLYITFGVMMVSLIGLLEILLAKLAALRRLYTLLRGEVGALQRRLQEQEKAKKDEG
jgi:hypothetical protein